MSVNMQPVTSSFQEVHLQCRVSNKSFLLNSVHASSSFSIRKNLWSSLMELASMLTTPWLIIGDFNDIVKASEKFGRHPPSQQKVNLFNSSLNTCGLVDLGFIGPLFTWTNNRNNGQIIRTHIDRAHTTLDWCNTPGITLLGGSIFLHVCENFSFMYESLRKNFRFQALVCKPQNPYI